MSEPFLKLIRSPEYEYLIEHHPNAFLLLTQIAHRAKRKNENPDGLSAGQSFIGDYKKAGIATEKQYRTAKTVLVQRGHIKIVETRKNRKQRATEGRPMGEKRAIERATNGTIVELLTTTIYDINFIIEGDREGDRRATGGREKGDKQEERNKNKETASPKPPSQKILPIGLVDSDAAFFDLIKDLPLSAEDKKTLMQYPIENVKHALEYSRQVPAKKSLMHQLIYAIKNPPKLAPTPESIAVKYNENISLKYPDVYARNKKLISQKKLLIFENGCFVQISLNKSHDELLKELSDSEKQVNERKESQTN